MKFNRDFVFLIGILTALAGTAVPALAVTNIGSCAGANITSPGNYQLTAKLTCAISITASNVSLKLNGYTISPGSAADGIDVGSPSKPVNHVAIQGPGLITGAYVGIDIQFSDYSQVALVTISNSKEGISVGEPNTFLTVASNVIGGSMLDGIFAEGCISCTISGNDVSGGASAGIEMRYGDANTVNNNTVNGNAGTGILIFQDTGLRVYGNVTNGNGKVGIMVNGPGTQIFSNTSSLANGMFDMWDSSLTCSGDSWSGNVFQTSASGGDPLGTPPVPPVSPATCIH
jgi:parallel beta-helix repeat protein